MRVIVDGANVVGSRPDGWWRDRPGAAARLFAELQQLPATDPGLVLVLVLEGAARAGVAETDEGPVLVVHAPGSGDDEIVRQARPSDGSPADLVVTADRGLRARLGDVAVAGPSWVWDRLA
jgi:hypothetical protein